jgi:uncharacterized membrane protein
MTANRMRIQGVDLLRGLVMVIMALDHVRDFYSPTAFPPEDLSQAGPALFLTRWITHYCAPTFVFLSGVSAWLQFEGRGRTRGEFGRFLATRGLWLILLELVLVNPSWDAAPFSFFFLQVIWAIGWSMIALALLVQGPRWLPLAFGLVVVLGHNALDPLQPASFGAAAPLWTVLHEGGWLTQARFGGVLAVYPILPWMGVMALGFGVSPWLVGEHRRERRIVLAGVAMIALFFALRLTNLYGNGADWAPDARGGLWSLLAALNVQKYPPSLQFLLMTLGPALILLVAFEHARAAWLNPIAVFGRVPLFYYLIHVPLIMLSAVAWATLAYGQPVNFFAGPAGVPEGYAPSLARAWLVWALVVFALYWPCAWYDRYKRAHPEKRFLRYL